eukprot:gene7763-630_t
MDPILFHGTKNSDTNFLSNFFESAIVLDGKKWPSTEHYFHAAKFPDEDYQECIRKAKNPAKAKQLGQSREHPIRHDWEDVKVGIMLQACLAKFRQNPILARRLLKTGSRQLIEHTEKDSIWGDGGDGTGKNLLGQVLMQVRDILQSESKNRESNSKKKLSERQQEENSPDMLKPITSIKIQPSGDEIPIVVEKPGDILNATEQYVAHQCNCISITARGLASAIFSKYPEANIYKLRKSKKKKDYPGAITVHEGRPFHIINMLAQRYPGQPRERDTTTQRLQWFQQCLEHIARIPDIQSIAFPHKIGCGLGGGDWDIYFDMITKFAMENPNVRVAIYKLS